MFDILKFLSHFNFLGKMGLIFGVELFAAAVFVLVFVSVKLKLLTIKQKQDEKEKEK